MAESNWIEKKLSKREKAVIDMYFYIGLTVFTPVEYFTTAVILLPKKNY